jgi:hypothetical protein
LLNKISGPAARLVLGIGRYGAVYGGIEPEQNRGPQHNHAGSGKNE